MKLVYIIFLFICVAGNSTNYYFSTSGSDGAAGSIGSPWQTISKFNSYFSSLSPGDSVLFKRGETFYGCLQISRSGSSGSPIKIGAYGTGANPTISGLTTLTSWTNLGSGKYEKTLSSPPYNSLNLVFFNDTIAPLGRYPKAGMGEESYIIIDSSHTDSSRWYNSNGIIINRANMTGIPSFIGGEVVHRSFQWSFDRNTVTAQNDTMVTFAAHAYTRSMIISYPPIYHHGFFFQNHPAAVTELGEWSYNQSTKKITMFFGGSGPGAYTTKVATLDSLVYIRNKSYINFSSLSFEGANENVIALDTSNYISISSCTFNGAGQNAIDVEDGHYQSTNHTTVINSNISNCLNNAVDCFESDNWLIRGDTTYNIGLIAGMGLSGDNHYNAISQVGDSSIVEYNCIHDIGYIPVFYKGNYDTVRNNHIYNYCTVKSDGGGVYTYGVSGVGRAIYNNIIHDGTGDLNGIAITQNPYSGQVHGIYCDAFSADISIHDNFVFRASGAGLFIGSNERVTVLNNIFWDNVTSGGHILSDQDTIKVIVIKHNQFISKDSGCTAMVFNNLSAVAKSGLTIDSNVYSRPVWQPSNLNGIPGFSSVPFRWASYTDGGIINYIASGASHFYSIDKWKPFYGKDLATHGAYPGVSTTDSIRVEYNATASPVNITLSYLYLDGAGAPVNNRPGPYALAPYTGIILLKRNDLNPYGVGAIYNAGIIIKP